MSQKRIFIVDDDPKIGELFAKVLARDGYAATGFTSAEPLLQAIDDGKTPDLVLTDLMMPDISGMELIEALRERGLTLPVIVMTAHSSVQTAVEAMRLGAFHYLQKPVNLEEMRALLSKALDLYSDKKELQEIKQTRKKKHDVGKIIGTSDEVQTVRDTIQTLADIPNTTVLVRGETGTGKNLVAQTLHYASKWAAGRFMEINCAALPDNLLESELFGYEKGAFTDARAAKPGLLEVADGGTLFLDEIDSMSLPLQSKLLSFLESRQFRRLGGTDEIKVTTRIVCATNANLQEKVAEKEFRKDLLFRINVVALELPPLRRMGRDALAIAEKVATGFAEEFAKPFDGFTEAAEEKLVAHSWPGNVRELRNVLERAMIFAKTPTLDAADLVLLQTDAFDGAASDADTFRFRSGAALEELEYEYIKHTLANNRNSSYADVAKLLGISKKTLWEKRKRYNLDEEVEEMTA
ncbi:Fis family transcriptional regulator [Rubrivirga sp. SAORIC476]|uniref:sigma-54-dependent transcriptional regulator n=1 Tax=Rubrivirga sp. SAORIC476 TaxID=1961794 RepID=UPI000BA9B403|nr:sigma-54 dependent transcriptional regulator [Rubrivirga sp. SAORIC476]MAQ95879.1 sigma-54-dependent Fis family transcriptional regulator [Rhodothermaceae bacterium]PAP81688.1 Fis family transcriptional regulator [Rubrivirga sp. SAORIC476]